MVLTDPSTPRYFGKCAPWKDLFYFRCVEVFIFHNIRGANSAQKKGNHMKINCKDYVLSKMTFAEVNAITPFKSVEKDDQDCSVYCDTDAVIEVEGLHFQPAYTFDRENEEAPIDEAVLVKVCLFAQLSGKEAVAAIHKWKDGIFEKYECTQIDEEYNMPDYRVEIAYPDESVDPWVMKVYTNSVSCECEVSIEVG